MHDHSQTIHYSRSALTFRPDLQSLRALAIGLVVAAHAGVSVLRGGYVGVDVFFVLSGYLISGLIWTEVQYTGRFDAVGFYARRLKRLAPALFIVLCCVAIVGWLVISPQHQASDSAAAKAAALWLSNFYFSARAINYFSAGVNSNLFLHTWSLGVEEQFYLVWPWLMLFLLGAWSWQGRAFNRRRLIVGWFVLTLLSLGLGVYWATTHLELAFYLMPGRAWEFGIGALVFVMREKTAMPSWLRGLQGASVLNSLGWLLIIGAAITLDDSLRYPGLYAIWPCAGAALVLLDRPEKAPDHILSRVVMRTWFPQFLGNLSYSLYLWHWPVLLLGQSVFGHGRWIRAALILLALALATTTYFGVERPVRHIRLRRRPWRALAAGLSITGIAFLATSVWQQTAVELTRSPAQMRIEAARFDAPALYSQPGCDTWFHSAEVQMCIFGPAKAPHTAVIFGDSVMAQWFPAITSIYLAKPGWRVAVLTKSACSASQVSYVYNQVHGIYTVCNIWRQRAIAEIVRLHPDVVFMGSTHYAFTAEQWLDGTRDVLDRLSPAAKVVLLMNPSPEPGFDGLDCLATQVNWPHWLPRPRSCSVPLRAVTEDKMHTLLSQAAASFANVHLIDLRKSICPDGLCRAEYRGRIVYRDGQHMTATFVRSLTPALLSALPPSARPGTY